MSYPRVSEILRIMDDPYAGVPQEWLTTAAERGIRLHGYCCQYLASLMGLCSAPAVPEEYRIAYEAFVDWARREQVEPALVEAQSTCPELRYQGTPDTLVMRGGKLLLIDLKFTAAISRLNYVQVNAYRKLEAYTHAQEAILLHINPLTGALKEYPVTPNPRDWCAFLNALSLYHWRTA